MPVLPWRLTGNPIAPQFLPDGFKEPDVELAELIVNALRDLDKDAKIQEDQKTYEEVSIDGTFNLRALAAMLLKRQSRQTGL